MGRPSIEITQEMTDIVIEMYQNNKPLREIEEAIGHCDSIVYKILNENSIPLKSTIKKFSEEQEQKIIELHNSGLTYLQLAEMYDCKKNAIKDIFKKYGLINSFSPEKIVSIINNFDFEIGHRKYYFDEHIFDRVDTPDKVYCIGLFMADGCNQLEYNSFNIELQERDKDILDKIQIMFQSDYPLHFRDMRNTKNMAQNTYKITYFSKYFCERLNELGIIPRKSLSLEFPKWIPNKLIPFLIKGYIDGDGWVQKDNIGFMSTYDFCLGTQKFLDSIGIKSKIMDLKRNYNENTKILYLNGRNNMIPLAEIMFSHGNLYIERKYQKYLEYGFLNNDIINNSQSA